jgi:RNA-directed DNA polymerase
VVSQRPRANTQDRKTLMAAWQAIPRKRVQRHAFRLQQRVYRAPQRGDVRTVRKRQHLPCKSWYARLFAVRRVTHDNRGKQTAGIDGVKALLPPQRWQLARELQLDGQATPLRRPWIPKRGSPEKRPLGIPTRHGRARQTLVRQALEPEWEAKLAPHTDGFRPGRSCWDAIAAGFHRLKFRPQSTLKGDIAKCFDRIDHQAPLANLPAPPGIRRHVRAWLRSGIMEDDAFSPTTAGTPQGGSGSPLLALIAPHGVDTAITRVYPEARVSAYADDGVVLHEDRSVSEHCQHLFMTWLAAIGLTLNVTKTHIRHALEGDQPGLDFLGFHIRQYRAGAHQAGKGPRGHQRLGVKPLITPAKANVKAHLAALGRIIRGGRAWPQAALIRQLNPKIRGWADSYRPWVSQAAFSRVDHLTWVKLRHWARRRHPNASAGWVYDRYWPRRGPRRGFAPPATHQGQVYLTSHREGPSLWHAKVAGRRSPDDGDWVDWSTRRGRDPTAGPRLATLLKRQGGRCASCGLFFQHGDQLEVDHLSGHRRDSRYRNLQALHGHRHDAKTRERAEDLPVGLRDKPPDTEERSARKRARSVLEQR